jgi:nicotinate (nicotinamide) nucleotide adenylyltransferase
VEYYDPKMNNVISSVLERKITNKNIEFPNIGIRIKTSVETEEISDCNFMSQWNKTINQKNQNVFKSVKIGLERNKFRTSYTSNDISSIYYGLSIDITHIIETEYYANSDPLYNSRYELELEIKDLLYHKSHPELFGIALADLSNMLQHIRDSNKYNNRKTAAVYFGSFDPPHMNHYGIAQRTMDKKNLDYLFWIPNTPNKLKGKSYSDIQHRINMIKLLIRQEQEQQQQQEQQQEQEQQQCIILSNMFSSTELKDKSMYVIDSDKVQTDRLGRANIIKFIETMYDINIEWQIVGSDSIRDTLKRTKNSNYSIITNNTCKFIVYPREGDSSLYIPKQVAHMIDIDYKHTEDLASSTHIRNNINNLDTISSLSNSVKNYIQQHGLYKHI